MILNDIEKIKKEHGLSEVTYSDGEIFVGVTKGDPLVAFSTNMENYTSHMYLDEAREFALAILKAVDLSGFRR